MFFQGLSVLLATLGVTASPAAPESTPRGGSAVAIGRTVSDALTRTAATSTAAATSAVGQVSGLSESDFQAYLPRLRQDALNAGVRRDTIDRIFPSLTFSARTVQLDRQQPGGTPTASNAPSSNPPFRPYLARHVTPALVATGRSRYGQNQGQIEAIGRRYGVDPAVMVAIWGKETSYGRIMGDFDLLNSLASLAYEGRRRELFTGEFVATLKMLERGFPRTTLKGSWAGATGQSQFLPSVYLRVSADGDGDGRADIWNNHLDALASIGNYLSNAGWRPGVPWGTEVVVPASLDRAAVANNLRAPRCARVFDRHSRWLSMGEWRRLGVAPVGSSRIADSEMVSLLEPDGPNAPAYLLTNNYRVILDYNCSNFYGLTVALLSERIAS